jgi:hypothetical protein
MTRAAPASELERAWIEGWVDPASRFAPAFAAAFGPAPDRPDFGTQFERAAYPHGADVPASPPDRNAV